MILILFFLPCLIEYVFAWRITACSDLDRRGSCSYMFSNGCFNADIYGDDTYMNDRINSIGTHGECVRLYENINCFGKSRAYYARTFISHEDLSQSHFGNMASSFGPCFKNECASYHTRGITITNETKCVYHDVIYVGRLNKPETEVKDKKNPITNYQRGHKDRVEYVKAIIRNDNLDTGTDPNDEVRNFVKAMGEPNDQVGYIVPKILGGLGTDTYNVFPINEKANRGELNEKIDKMVYDGVKQYGWMEMIVNLQYESDESTRPYVITYRFHGDKYYRIRDFINPK